MSTTNQKNICHECGASNELEALECNTCGSDLSRVPEALEPEQVGPAPQQAPPTDHQRARRPLDFRDYFIFILGALVVALVIFIFATPEEKTGPPEQATMQPGQPGQGGLPPGHPPTGSTGPSEQQIALEKELNQQLNEKPDDDELRLRYANLLYDMGRHDQAVSHYLKYLKNNPDDADARTDMAYSMFKTDDVQEAINELHHVLHKEPGHQPAVYNLSIMHMNLDNPDSVLYYLGRVAEIDPNSTMGQNAKAILDEYNKSHPSHEGHDHE